MLGRERKLRAWLARALALCLLGWALPAEGAPIKSILIDHVGGAPAPLGYTFDQDTGEGVLRVDIESFTVVITREPDNGTEFIPEASFTMLVTDMSDVSNPPFAAGLFQFVEFELWDRGGQEPELLLKGRQLIDAGLSYAETPAPDLMSILSDPVEIIGGSLAVDFDTHAILFGMGLNVEPGTGDFDRLDTDHSGSIKLKLLPIPEPGTVLLLALLAAWVGRVGTHRRG